MKRIKTTKAVNNDTQTTQITVDTTKKETKAKKHYTSIDEKKPDNEVVADVVHDVELVIDWWYAQDKCPSDIDRLIQEVNCKNTLHGMQILKKICSIDGITLNDDFMFGVILHDVVKYKKRVGVINGIFTHYLGEGKWVDTGDHGINAGYLLTSLFDNSNIKRFNFVFMHAKNHPFKLNPDNWSDCEVAFFVFDDLIRDIKKYKTKLPKNQYEIIHNYFRNPILDDTRAVFNILAKCNNSSKK